MSTIDSSAFEAELVGRGCPQLGIVDWPPGRISAEHAHEFTACGLILDGEFTLETPAGQQLLHAGDRFEVTAGTLHVERVGNAGVRILSGRLSPV